MNIEICTPNSATTKDKGDLLEKLSKNMLEAQNYHVDEEVRKTGSELDLLCKHNVSKKKIYVECKAYRDKKIDATIIRHSVHDKFHRTLILSGFCLLKIAKIS
ncbi:restriction endonuclease, partial [Acinetobacter baumannii]